MLHHRTLFPLLVFGLTIVLGAVIFILFKDEAMNTQNRAPITSLEYQSEVHGVVGTLQADISSAQTNEERVQILEATRDELLALIVPSDYQEVHLNMVVTLSNWIAGYNGEEGKRVAAEQYWSTLVSQYYWIE